MRSNFRVCAKEIVKWMSCVSGRDRKTRMGFQEHSSVRMATDSGDTFSNFISTGTPQFWFALASFAERVVVRASFSEHFAPVSFLTSHKNSVRWRLSSWSRMPKTEFPDIPDGLDGGWSSNPKSIFPHFLPDSHLLSTKHSTSIWPIFVTQQQTNDSPPTLAGNNMIYLASHNPYGFTCLVLGRPTK